MWQLPWIWGSVLAVIGCSRRTEYRGFSDKSVIILTDCAQRESKHSTGVDMNTKIPTVKACGDFASGRCFEKIDDFNLVNLRTIPVETLFGELEYIEPRLKALGVNAEAAPKNS
jgi:hypothetical protein